MKNKTKSEFMRKLDQRYIHEDGGKWRIRFYILKGTNLYKHINNTLVYVNKNAVYYKGKPVHLTITTRDHEENPVEVEVAIEIYSLLKGEKRRSVESQLEQTANLLIEDLQSL